MPKRSFQDILISFVGTNDSGSLSGKEEGAILTVFKERVFTEVHLIWTPPRGPSGPDYAAISTHVKDVLQRKYNVKTVLHELSLLNVTDHNEIYPKLLELCRSLSGKGTKCFTAAISSGTPAMQVCWILMAESGDFPMSLIRSHEPKFGLPLVNDVRLGTTLPNIIRLRNENETLKKANLSLIPKLVLNVSKGTVSIDRTHVNLSPIEFCYYRYFAERAKKGLEYERFTGISTPTAFVQRIADFYVESFPEAELDKAYFQLLKANIGIAMTTFRGNISKTNKKFSEVGLSPFLKSLYQVSVEGKRFATCYGVQCPRERIGIR